MDTKDFSYICHKNLSKSWCLIVVLEVGGWVTNNYKYSACLVIRVQLVVTWCPGSSAASLLVLTGHKTSHSFNSWPRHHLLPTLMRTWTNLSRLIKPMAALQSRRESVFGKCRPAAPVRRRLGCNYTSSEHSLQPVIESLNILCWLHHKWHYNMQKVTEHWAATINKYLQWIWFVWGHHYLCTINIFTRQQKTV